MQNFTHRKHESSNGGAAQAEGEHGRGRSAERPSDIPMRGWKDILLRVKDEIDTHNIVMIAGGIAFFSMLAIFPALIAAVSIYGLVVSPADVEQQIQSVSGVLPPQARDVLGQQLHNIVTKSNAGLGWSALLGLIGALWSASAGMEKLMLAISIAYDQPNHRGMIKQRGLALLLTLGFIVTGIVALGLVAVLPGVLEYLRFGAVGEALVRYGRWPALAAIIVVGLGVLYALAPNRDRPKWRWVSWGSALATGLWVLASIGFSIYVSNFDSYGETYGTIGGVIVLMLWLFITSFLILLGAEVNAEMEAQTAKDSTVGSSKPMGHRGAVKADELGEAKGAKHN